jgi:hypothetical protein
MLIIHDDFADHVPSMWRGFFPYRYHDYEDVVHRINEYYESVHEFDRPAPTPQPQMDDKFHVELEKKDAVMREMNKEFDGIADEIGANNKKMLVDRDEVETAMCDIKSEAKRLHWKTAHVN